MVWHTCILSITLCLSAKWNVPSTMTAAAFINMLILCVGSFPDQSRPFWMTSSGTKCLPNHCYPDICEELSLTFNHVPANGLVPFGNMPFTGSMMTTVAMHIIIYHECNIYRYNHIYGNVTQGFKRTFSSPYTTNAITCTNISYFPINDITIIWPTAFVSQLLVFNVSYPLFINK